MADQEHPDGPADPVAHAAPQAEPQGPPLGGFNVVAAMVVLLVGVLAGVCDLQVSKLCRLPKCSATACWHCGIARVLYLKAGEVLVPRRRVLRSEVTGTRQHQLSKQPAHIGSVLEPCSEM